MKEEGSRWWYWTLWFFLAVVVFSLQLVNIFYYDNRMKHLTNWAWILNGVGLIFYGLESLYPRGPWPYFAVPFYVMVWSVTIFVGSGVTYITLRDNTMLKEIEERVGAPFFWGFNVLFHYVPICLWLIVILLDKKRIAALFRSLPIYDALFLLNGVPLYFVTAYGVIFNPHIEYPGDHLSFETMYIVSTGCIFFFGLFPLVIANY